MLIIPKFILILVFYILDALYSTAFWKSPLGCYVTGTVKLNILKVDLIICAFPCSVSQISKWHHHHHSFLRIILEKYKAYSRNLNICRINKSESSIPLSSFNSIIPPALSSPPLKCILNCVIFFSGRCYPKITEKSLIPYAFLQWDLDISSLEMESNSSSFNLSWSY